ncbi:MAG: PAS domain S-box protein [Pseudolabrys sp.]
MEQSGRLAASLSEDGRYRLLVEAVTDYAIYMLDPSGVISSWNPGAQRFKGYTADEIIGQHFSRFYTDEDRASGLPARALETAVREGKFESEGWRVRKDGTRFWAYVIIDPIRESGGELVGFAKITRDLTERREAQEKLERTREALLQSQKMEAIGQLTGGVAHDFNNLLMAVLGSLELMRKRLPDDPKVLGLLDNAMQGAQRGTALTKRMLAFARRQELKQEAVDIPNLVRGMADLLRRSLGATVTLETRFPLMLDPVLADASQLEMALLNLTVNARDAMMPNGGHIVISAREETIPAREVGLAPGAYVRLAVSDSGTGMDAATLRRATEPFFTTKEPGKGTGLGLSMVHGLAEQFGGRFGLQSRLGEGTVAELWLPVASKASEPETPPPRRDHDAGKSQPLVVLAVDDDALVLTNTAAMLEDLGHTCRAVLSAAEALEFLKTDDTIDLVITDQVMARMTGLQLADAIHRQWPQIPVLLATGYAEIEPEAAAQVPTLAKPFTQAELAAQIARLAIRPRNGGQILKFRGHGTE